MTLSIQLIQIPEGSAVSQREFYLQEQSFKIGRDFDADICLPDQTGTLSRTHFVISQAEDGSYTVKDTSINGTRLNDELLYRNTVMHLSDGDILSFCDYKLLVGIIEDTVVEPEVAEPAYHPQFTANTDMNSDELLIPDAPTEPVIETYEEGFSHEEVPLDHELMFDPFADGPEIQEEPTVNSVPPRKSVEHFNLVEREHELVGQTAAPASVPVPSMPFPPENILAAMERTISRFLEELDPEVLQTEYDEYLPAFVNRSRRYWRIYKHQFARKKANRDYHHTFLAIFADEIRKR